MNISRKSLVVVFALASCLEASAGVGDVAAWANVTEKVAQWQTPANWTDGQGAPLAVAPGAGEDILLTDGPELPAHNAYVAESNLLGDQTINYAPSNGFDLQMGSVTGDAHHTLCVDADNGPSGHTFYKNAGSVTVDDPTDFFGFWRFGGMELAVTTPASASQTPVYRNFSAKHNPVLKGSDAAGTTVIESLYDAGAVSKEDAGALRIKATSGEQSVVYLKGGSALVLDGVPGDALASLLETAALHLDASVESSLVRERASDGLVSVQRWKDVRGESGRYQFEAFEMTNPPSYQIPNSNPPFLSENAKSPTGLTLVDFGARSSYGVAEYPERGRTNCVMRLAKDGDGSVRLTGVREAFYAVSSPKGARTVQILSDKSSIHYMCASDTSLFDATYSDPAVRHGDLIFNGSKHASDEFSAQELTDLYTLGVGVGRDTSVSWLGTRQLYASTTGGSRMGEILLFTNDLTRAERMRICRYLDAKWRTGNASKSDLAALHVSSSVPTVEVPESDHVARIGMVEVPGKVLNKTGAGTLVIGQLTDGTTVNVQGGKVLFSGLQVADSGVAANPYVHLDAATIGDEDVEVVEGISYVNVWRDAFYDTMRQATSALEGTGRPTLITSALVSGKKVVDFGLRDKSNGTGAWMKLCSWNDASLQTYAGFMVLRYKESNSGAPHFGSSQGMTFYRDNYGVILSSSYKNHCLGAALWRVNGEIVCPFASSALNVTNRFVVLSFSSGHPVRLDAIVANKGGQSSVKDSGGLEVGEVVVYDRPLSEGEILSTEAYLMKKWLGSGKTDDATISELSVGENDTADLSSDLDMTIGTLTGGDGTIVKGGTGSVRVGTLGENPTAVDVRGGSLVLPIAVSTFLDEALFHLDASRLDTMTYTVENGVTNVSEIADVRGNGFKATALIDELATVHPKLASVETSPGSGRYIPALDFGGYSWKTNDYASLAATPSAAMKYSSAQTVKQAITVFADAHGAHQQSVFSQSNGHDFQRNWNTGTLYWGADKFGTADVQILKASSIVRNAAGGTLLDGLGVNVNTAISEGFHIYDFIADQSRTERTQSWTTPISAIAMSYGKSSANNGVNWSYDYPIAWNDRGGQYVAEQIGFNRMLTTEEQTYLKSLLDYKWFGGARPDDLASCEMASISVAKGSSLVLNVGDATSVTTRTLGGAGTIAVNKLTVTDSIDVTIANGPPNPIVVNGKVVLDGNLTVNVTVDPSFGRIEVGLYPILTASALDGDASFTVNVLKNNYGVYSGQIVREDDTLYLKTARKGLILLVQ